LAENTLAYLIFSLDADLRRIESELNYKLFSNTRLFVEFDRDGLLSMDPEKTATVMQSEISSGVSTINEARRKKNRPPVKGGDIPLINSTNVPLTTQAAKGPDKPAPVPQPSPGQQE
ncbi:phage portal protein, partial [Gluconobacter oxydans]